MSEKAVEKHVDRIARMLGEKWAHRQNLAKDAARDAGATLIAGQKPSFREIASEKLWERMARIAAREIEEELRGDD